jgi:Zn-dependent protease
MDQSHIAQGLIFYLLLVSLLTFHEFGHAWTAMKLGDDTAKDQGRVSLNPLVHIDPIGTVLMPLLMIFLPANAGRFLLGWAKPVPVNLANLKHRNRDDALITLAGPGMNLLLAAVLVVVARAAVALHQPQLAEILVNAAELSLMLCFFNLLPVPPLDGSHIMRIVVGMSYETYWRISQFGFLIVIGLLQVPLVSQTIGTLTEFTLNGLCRAVGLY